LSSGFVFEERKALAFPDNQELIDIAKWNRENQSGKRAEHKNLSEIDKLRAKAEKGNL
jgi:hypothetical protein